MKKVVIIGSGFAGLSAACFLARDGWDVVVVEKNEKPGGRARQLHKDGFVFDMGPSWYWMPDVFERFFHCFGKKVGDYYSLDRLNPSYRVCWPVGTMDIPADYGELKNLFESIEQGSGEKLDLFLKEAAYKYDVGINKLVHKPGKSLTEFIDSDLLKGVFRLDVFTSISNHINKYFKDKRLRQLLEFPVLFLGALPQDTPALYSLMNYADIKLGTWYPQGGMHQIVQAMYTLAKELKVKFHFNQEVVEIKVENKTASGVMAVCKTVDQFNNEKKEAIFFEADVVLGNADYHHVESKLLKETERSYTESYWQKRVMAPSCLIYYVGLNKKLKDVVHHTLFFDVDFEEHGKQIYTTPQWPTEPLFYVSVTSVTDPSVAPEGCENLFFLVPVATGLTGDTTLLRNKYFEKIVKRYEQKIGQTITDSIVVQQSYSVSNFIEDYHSFKGNAYGLANTLMQTAVLKPSLKSKKIKNLFYTGQLTVPGPGVPPSLISGEVVAKEIVKEFG